MQDINLRHLSALTVIADAGSLSTAAERVHLSQSALTQALRKIEVSAGMPLFERTGFGVTPTDAGQLLVRRCRRAFSLFTRAEREIHQQEGVVSEHKNPNRHVTASQLRALIAIVETGGYSLAARKLGLAQPTVYRAAKDLEARLGIQFFHRTARGVKTNKSARLLARHAELMFAEIRQGFEEVSELQGQMRSRVSVGCLPLARGELLPQAVTQLLSTYPEAKVRILDGPFPEQLHALRYGRVDWIIGDWRSPVPSSDILQQHLFKEPLAIVVRNLHPLLGPGSPEPAALAELEWIAPWKNTPARNLFTAFFIRSGVPVPKRIIECSSLVATRALLQDSDRAALLSPSQIRNDIATMQLAILGDPLPETSRSIGLTVRADWEPTLVQAEFTKIIHSIAHRYSSGSSNQRQI